MNWGIYFLQNKTNNKIYVGMTKNFKKRGYDERYCLRTNNFHCTHLQNSWNKYGEENFEWFLVEEGLTFDEVNEAEIYYIACIRNTVLEDGSIVNMAYNEADGGQGSPGSTKSPETREKISKSRKGKCKGIEHPQYGKRPPDERLEKMAPTMFKKGLIPWNRGMKDPMTPEQKEKRRLTCLTLEFHEKASSCKLGKLNPMYKHAKCYEAFGEKKPLSDWVKDPRCVVSYIILRGRRDSGWGMEKSLITPRQKKYSDDKKIETTPKKSFVGKGYFAFGEEKSIKQWVDDPRCVVDINSLWYRIKVCNNMEICLTATREEFTAYNKENKKNS